MSDAIAAALAGEFAAAQAALDKGATNIAWHHLERVHILAQTSLVAHIVSHWKMLRLSLAEYDGREAAGQLVRLALAPLGNLTGRLSIGNTGRSTLSVFAPMDIPPDLAATLDRKAD